MTSKIATLLICLGFFAGCSHEPSYSSAPKKDGETTMPSNYTNWPMFIGDIDKVEGKQVRDIYINTNGVELKKGDDFPNGTVFVMDLYSAQLKADDTPKMDASGKLMKDKLTKVFIMEKSKGSGATAPESLANGDWVYTAYNADGTKADVNYEACRGCHLAQVSDKDFIFHYNQYFDK